MLKLPQFPAYATFADKLGWWLVRVGCVAVLAFLLAPILVVIPLSFSDSSFLAYPIPGWSLKWYRNLFESPEWARAARPHSDDWNRFSYHLSDQPGMG